MAMTDGLFVHGHRGLVRPLGLHTKNFVYFCIDILQSGLDVLPIARPTITTNWRMPVLYVLHQ